MSQINDRNGLEIGALLIAGICLVSGLVVTRPASADDNFSFHGRIYADVTGKENKDKGTNTKSDDSGFGTDVKRVYLEFGYKVDNVWSAHFVSDIGDQGTKRYDIFVKKAYLEANFSKMADLRIGSTDLPWIPFVEHQYGYRYLENTLTDREHFGTSADWGVHMKGGNDMVQYAFGVINGRGYSDPTRSQSVDFEGRISLTPAKGLTLGLGGYSGKRGKDLEATPALHNATRFDLLANYRNDRINVGGEYFTADNWNNVTSVATDSADGMSVWVSAPVSNVELFARFDQTKPSKDLNPDLKSTYYNAGVQFKPAKLLKVAVAFKHATVDSGLGGHAAGVGSTIPGAKGESNEIGVWAQYKW